jgi:hypothetical protein
LSSIKVFNVHLETKPRHSLSSKYKLVVELVNNKMAFVESNTIEKEEKNAPQVP